MLKIKIFISIIIATAVILPSNAFAAESIERGFNANKLIEDSTFKDKHAMGSAAAVQKFLEDKNSVLANTSSSFTSLLNEPTSSSLKSTLEDPDTSSSGGRTAAQLIWAAAQSSGLNPQVILVTLQKEQSLITGRQTSTPEQLQRALNFAMGFGCPDSQPCGELYKGFYYQLFGNVDSEGNRYLGAAKSLMKSFSTPGGRGPYYNGSVAKVGDTIVLNNTLGGYSGVEAQQSVTIKNSATAALYRYTPHVFNGNYNFWRYMNSWFGSTVSDKDDKTVLTNGSIVKVGKIYYMIQDSKSYRINDFVKKFRDIDTRSKKVKSLSTKEFKSYPEAGLLGLADNTVIKFGDKFYVFITNKMYEASESVLKQRGLTTSGAKEVTEENVKEFMPALLLPPNEGTVLRGKKGPEVYIVENAQLRLVSALIFKQRNLAGKVQIVPDEELLLYQKGGFLAPLDGTMVKSPKDPTVSLIANRIRRPIPSLAVFKTYGKTFAEIETISDDEFQAIPLGALAEPRDNIYYKVAGSGDLYVYRNASRHFIAAYVALQRGISPDITLEKSESDSWPEGEPVMPKDGTLVKSVSAPSVYIVENGVLKELSGADFKARGLSFKNVNTLSASDIAKMLNQGEQQ